MEYLVIGILLIIVILLLVKLFLLKKEIRKATARLSKDDNRALPVDGVDKDLGRLIARINRMYEDTLRIRNEANKDEKALRNSISMISHDMKTPLTSVIGYLQLARKSEGDEVQKNIDIALERAKYLNELVNDFFEVSLVDSGKYVQNPETMNICEIICEEIFALSPSFDKRGIEPGFENSDEDIRITTDRKMFKRIIQNLLSNCIKYSENKTDLSVKRDNGKVRIKIISGCCNKVDTDKMFDKFYREDEARTGEGAGLGMYICKKFTERLGGDIFAEQIDDELIVNLTLPETSKTE